MATRTVKTVVDGFDGSTEGIGTYRFSLEEVGYEIDLSADNRDLLRAALAPFIAAGRRLPKATRASRAAPATAPPPRCAPGGPRTRKRPACRRTGPTDLYPPPSTTPTEPPPRPARHRCAGRSDDVPRSGRPGGDLTSHPHEAWIVEAHQCLEPTGGCHRRRERLHREGTTCTRTYQPQHRRRHRPTGRTLASRRRPWPT